MTFTIDTPEIVDAPEMPWVGVRHRVTMQQMDQPAQSFATVAAWIAEHGATSEGPPFYKYEVIDMEAELTVVAGFAVDEPQQPDDTVFVGTLPAGRYLTVTHVGHPQDLVEVTRQLLEYAASNGLTFDCTPDQREWAARLEFYVSDESADMTTWETELAFKLAD
ncbi:GyrI-like domain-containing protein [Aestuariimicrobium kwangyangense]|uniref:GyrI-like domain-containing protein n=1 Tax=Aestuariimicrobium kwangyangense TaxID=396389 RepID=UPI0003B532FF|nr:GyrI-like domain-containing protein [Aestuariimicrobium kwangyangense]